MSRQQVQITPMAFSEAMYMLEGQPFRFTAGRNYLQPIHNAEMDETLLMTGRQVEKSTTTSVKIGNNVLLRNFSRSLYVAPMNEQVKTFSRGRLDKLFRYSQKDLVKLRYMSNELSNQVFHKEFKNGSEIYLRNCYEEADNIRGLSIDDIFIDEVQDINVDAIPVIMETQTRSKRPHLFLTGTPKTFSNTIQQQWERSSQADWVVRCTHCGKHQVLGVSNVSPTGFICRNPKCSRPMPDIVRAMGVWEHRKPQARMKGFRITQMMVPDIDPAKIFNKIATYPKNRLYNEVLGKAFENADKPFTDMLLNDITMDDVSTYTRIAGINSEFANKPIYMGIDWGEGEKNGQQGTGYTVMVVCAFNKDGKFQNLFAKRFERGDELDADYQLEFALKLMAAFKVDMCIADYGAGQKENQRLKKKLGTRFFQCHYVGRQKQKLVHETEVFKFKIPRSPWLTDFVEFVQDHNLIFPGKDNPELLWIHKNFSSIYSEYRSSKGGVSEELFYGHSVSEPDDAVHAFFYSWLASKIHSGGKSRNGSPGRRNSMFTGTYGA